MNDIKPYTDIEAIENYILKDIDSGFTDQVDEWIVAMSRWIDNFCNRDITRTEEETFIYDGDGTNITLIKDCVDLTEVKVDDVIVPVLEYPTNKDYTSRIVLSDDVFRSALQNIEVTAIHGMTKVVPDQIKTACTILVAGIINSQTDMDKAGTTEKFGNYSVSYSKDQQKQDFATVKDNLTGYKRIAI